jgi:hypothetical protein
MNVRSNVALDLAVIGSFIAALALGMATSFALGTGLLLVVTGAVSIAFSRRLAEAQQELSEKPFIPSNWAGIRPLTFVLWGTGVVVVGLSFVFGI